MVGASSFATLNGVFEDLETFWAEFDLQGLISPNSPEHFLLNLGSLVALAVVVYVAYRALSMLY